MHLTDAQPPGRRDAVPVTRLRLLIVDEQQAFADALAALLATAPDLQVLGAATDVETAVGLTRSLRPDVVTLDVDGGSSDAVNQLHRAYPPAAIVVVTTSESPYGALHAVCAGATAWVPKHCAAEELFGVLRLASDGGSWFPPRLLGQLLRELAQAQGRSPLHVGPLGELTPREYDVLMCLVEGLDRKASAYRLRLSVNTVRTHVQSLFIKLGVHNTLEAVAVALDAGVRAPAGPRRLASSRHAS